MRRALLSAWIPMVWLACASTPEIPPPPPAPTVTGFWTLPAESLAEGPASGAALSKEKAKGAPWEGQPIQGFSGLVPIPGADEAWVLSDNGYGTAANSGDFRLVLQRIRWSGADGELRVIERRELSDPDGVLGVPRAALTGAELDPESLQRLPDGRWLIGEELGPSLLLVRDDGRLERRVDVPLPEAFAALGRGAALLRAPTHPSLAALAEPARLAAASVAPSKGIEALALLPDGKTAWIALEAALLDEPDRTRVLLLELELQSFRFTGASRWYRTELPEGSLTDAVATGPQTLVVIERDEGEGDAAKLKRLYEIRLDRADETGRLEKRLVADLLALRDPDDLGPSTGGLLRLPQLTPEGVAALSATTLLVLTDNNFPFGKARGESPEESELVRIELPRPLR